MKDVDKSYTYLVENDEMSTLLKLKLAKCLEEHCVRTRKHFDDLYAQWDNYSDDDGEPGELPNPFEDPSELYPMTCQDAPICKDKTDAEMTAYCAIYKERGHPACMAEMKANIILHPEQVKGAQEFKITPRLCVLCDKYHGLFYKVQEKCHNLVRLLSQRVGKDEATAVTAAVKASFAQPLDEYSSSSDEKEAAPSRSRTNIGGDGEGG